MFWKFSDIHMENTYVGSMIIWHVYKLVIIIILTVGRVTDRETVYQDILKIIVQGVIM